MKLHWLKLVKPCTLDLSQVKDYAGQPLIFNQGSFTVRCVTDEALAHPLVKRYQAQRMLVEVAKDGTLVTSSAPAAAPSASKAAAPKPKPKPAPEPEPEPEPTPEPEPEPEPAPVVEDSSVSDSSEEVAFSSTSSSKRKRSRRSKK